MLDIKHAVELRCGRREREPGVWIDAWRRVGDPWVVSEFAQQHADTLRAQGLTVRVRPVFN